MDYSKFPQNIFYIRNICRLWDLTVVFNFYNNHGLHPHFARQHLLYDEKNSIHIDFYFNDATFHSLFTVQQNLLASSYELKDGKIHFDIIIYDLAQPRQTGGKNNIPEVNAYRVKSIQNAVLEKSH